MLIQLLVHSWAEPLDIEAGKSLNLLTVSC